MLAMSMKYLARLLISTAAGSICFSRITKTSWRNRRARRKDVFKILLHNGLTRMKTKLASGEWQNEKMSGSLGNVVRQQLIDKQGRSAAVYAAQHALSAAIEFTDEVISNAKKGLSFSRD